MSERPTPFRCPVCLLHEYRYSGEADRAWLPGFDCTRCAHWHVERCRAGRSEVCSRCAPAVSFELRDRVVGRILEILDGIPPDEVVHLDGIIEVLGAALSYAVPLSGERPGLLRARRLLEAELAEQRRIQSPNEQRLRDLLDGAGLAGEFEPQRVLEVEYMRADGAPAVGATTPDFTHRHLAVVIYCDSRFHLDLKVLERDGRVIDALQARGFHVLRFTRAEIDRSGAGCIARIRRALARANRQGAA